MRKRIICTSTLVSCDARLNRTPHIPAFSPQFRALAIASMMNEGTKDTKHRKLFTNSQTRDFSTLKRVVKGPGSCCPQRESIQTTSEKVKCKCTGERTFLLRLLR